MPYMTDTKIRPHHCESSMDSKLKKMRDELRTNNVASEHGRKIQRVKKTRTLSGNIEKVLEFDRECEQNGHKISSRYSVLISLHYLCQFAGKRPFKQLTKLDLLNFLDHVKDRKFEDTRYRVASFCCGKHKK